MGCGGTVCTPANSTLYPQLLEVNKQWDQHFRAMKQKYEQKVGLGVVLGLHTSAGHMGCSDETQHGEGA